MDYFKYSGSGNTFLITEYASHGDAASLCIKHQVDGLILIQPSKVADFKMRIFNADGSEPQMCGNGMRCAVKYLLDIKGEIRKQLLVETPSGIRKAYVEDDVIGVSFPYPKMKKFHLFDLKGYFLNTGVPHAVFFVDDLEDVKWMELAPKIRSHPFFGTEGTNVNFVKLVPLLVNALRSDRVKAPRIDAGPRVRNLREEALESLSMRTYERGVGETLSCGTGTVAAAFAVYTLFGLKPPLNFLPKSGESLLVDFKEDYLILLGPANLLQNLTLV